MRTNPFGMQEQDSSELEDVEEQDELEEQRKKKRKAQSSMLNIVNFEDCDFENVTIIMNFEGPD